MERLRNSYSATNAPPCDGCENRKACRVNELACDAFNSWAENGRVKSIHVERFQPTRAGMR